MHHLNRHQEYETSRKHKTTKQDNSKKNSNVTFPQPSWTYPILLAFILAFICLGNIYTRKH